jgi:hypothetical protein
VHPRGIRGGRDTVAPLHAPRKSSANILAGTVEVAVLIEQPAVAARPAASAAVATAIVFVRAICIAWSFLVLRSAGDMSTAGQDLPRSRG